ncbi:class I SAM-dependent rRNA methyltransferase [Vagococcus sp.]|uniref:class I SAM-dependent rRNA methyltransferase n=1 Tax=Vagococcus sp. TaxID=1933889 RepID=UPI003F96DB49
MKEIVIKNEKNKKFKHLFPLISPHDLLHQLESIPNEWLKFIDEKKRFLGYGYLGVQNKGIGWLLSFSEDEPISVSFLENIFITAFSNRQVLMNDDDTTAFRLFNGEGDGFGGITIDWYDKYLVISWYNETIYSFKEDIIKIIEKILKNEIIGIYEKVRFQSKLTLADSSFISGKEAPTPLLIKENGINYATHLNDGLMTGIFLDQRDVRQRLMEELSMGKKVLNTFSYTGAFSVAALMGGALETTSVDLAKRSLNKTQEMFEVNAIDPETQEIIVMDVFNYYKYAMKKDRKFDLIILDPPSFSRNKKKTFSVAKNYAELVEEAVAILNPEGTLIASSNAANVSLKRFEEMIENGIKKNERKYKKLFLNQLPTDFAVSKHYPEGNYLKVLIYQIY